MRKHHVFSTLVESQKNSYELIMTSVLIAVGVNLLSTGIIELIGFEYKEAALIAIGIIISLGVVIRISHSKIKELNQAIKIKGFIIYNKENHKILGIPEYEISTDMERYLDCAFSENKALEKLWNENNISQFEFDGREDNEAELESSRYSSDLFVELLEYCVIEKLSTHLLDYFNEFDEKQHVQEFHKNDIPEVLLSNRFLKLFSEDMRNREIFVCQDGYWGDDASDGIVVAQNASGGLYQRFDLILPEKSKIIRKNKNEIIIETPILTLKLSCLFEGYSTVLKSGFSKYYLGIENFLNYYHTYGFDIEVAVKFKFTSLFSKEKEIYYAWIDSFLDELSGYIGKEDFFKRIDWDTVYTMLRCSNIADRYVRP